MAHRPHPKGTTTNPAAGPWSACDFCGFLYSLSRLGFQYDFYGGSVPQNSGYLVCDHCRNDLAYQFKLLILPPDPKPIFNTRPEPYAVDETDWLTTQDDDIITTQDGELFTPSVPNPAQSANLTNLACDIAAPSASVSVLYLDLFDGDPTAGGVSILLVVTGSATRTNIASNLTTTSGIVTNTSPIVVSLAAESNANVSYVGFYSAATAGSLLISGTVSATFPTIVQGAAVQFDSLGISIDTN